MLLQCRLRGGRLVEQLVLVDQIFAIPDQPPYRDLACASRDLLQRKHGDPIVVAGNAKACRGRTMALGQPGRRKSKADLLRLAPPDVEIGRPPGDGV